MIHRELTSSYTAKFVIEKTQMYVENANRAVKDGVITPENLEPKPKNPIIAAFFRNIGYSDQLGSGVRKLFKYTKFYSGKEPEFKEGDVFRITVPLDEGYSFDFGENEVFIAESATDATESATDATESATEKREVSVIGDNLRAEERKLLFFIKQNPRITQRELYEASGISLGTIKRILPGLQKKGKLIRIGNRRSGEWKITE